ncbi:MAG: DUF4860 domain-containing protein [Butyrivibrio sp.]|nr:DUF4860 domain-containing protein [Butyrivibrio sp.]
MKQNRSKRHIIDIAFITALTLLFAFSSILLIVLGANIYQKNILNINNNYSKRTAFAYVTEKIRQADNNGEIGIASVDDITAVTLLENIDGEEYITYLYCYGGYLTELITKKDTQNLLPEAGQKIVEIEDFNINEIGDNFYKIDISELNSNVISMYITIRSGKENA